LALVKAKLVAETSNNYWSSSENNTNNAWNYNGNNGNANNNNKTNNNRVRAVLAYQNNAIMKSDSIPPSAALCFYLL